MSDDEILTIPMSNRRPVTIVASEWTLIAEAELGHAWAAIRQHDDGRMIVYGHMLAGHERAVVGHAGYIVDPRGDYAHALSMVSTELNSFRIDRAVLAKMPPERI